MSPFTSRRRCAAFAAKIAAAGLSVAVATMAFPTTQAQAVVASRTEFDTIADLMAASGLSGTVYTAGDEYADDGAGMQFSVESTLPDGVEGNIAVPLADDNSWAVPQGLPTSAPRSANSAAVEDLISRAQSFYDAGSQLVWDSSRPTPLTGTVVHSDYTAPYGITCSTFVSMTLLGWDYNHTTYVDDANTQVGYAVDFGVDPSTSKIWRANNLASWFYANGDLWLETDGNYERGDILFFSTQDPEGMLAQVRSGDEATYFGNVYHAAIYLGDGLLIHSTGIGDGVNITALGPTLEADLSFVARPAWTKEAANTGSSTDATQSEGASSQGSTSTGSENTDRQDSLPSTTTGTGSGATRVITPVPTQRQYSRAIEHHHRWS
ncbi:hypothetical protein [Actinomyces sp. MRS3W]|uniref:hypothetical protein n=1 Tax=Actinomyces sp. MRS3W TaxID=2800796 RepID=UPI0028FDACCA|nr:hypothetical protein [Actinomyces sp. MRS3W]MDU0349152.1 hypothetical protein [Actinomyces sp. MRS3W]MDU0349161.1 hypothetical protein [Actinomyces sp. MRS3W]